MIDIDIGRELNVARHRFPGVEFEATRDLRRHGLNVSAVDTSSGRWSLIVSRFVPFEVLSWHPCVFQDVAEALVLALEAEATAACSDPVDVAVDLVGFERHEVRDARLVLQEQSLFAPGQSLVYMLEVDLVDSDWEPTYEFTSLELTKWQRERAWEQRQRERERQREWVHYIR